MKKFNKVLLCTTVFLMLGGGITSFAGEWKSDSIGYWYEKEDGNYIVSDWFMDDGKYYYFNGDGYMMSNAWIGNYYVGEDGAMLTNTITPDGYQVDENGAWIPENSDSRPMAPYCNVISNPLFYGGAQDYLGEDGIFVFWGEQSNWTDYGSYYGLGGQELYFYKTYNTQKEAKQCRYYRTAYGGGKINKLPNGKYAVCDSLGDYEVVTTYAGSIYFDKNTTISYYDYVDSTQRNSRTYTCTLEE